MDRSTWKRRYAHPPQRIQRRQITEIDKLVYESVVAVSRKKSLHNVKHDLRQEIKRRRGRRKSVKRVEVLCEPTKRPIGGKKYAKHMLLFQYKLYIPYFFYFSSSLLFHSTGGLSFCSFCMHVNPCHAVHHWPNDGGRNSVTCTLLSTICLLIITVYITFNRLYFFFFSLRSIDIFLGFLFQVFFMKFNYPGHFTFLKWLGRLNGTDYEDLLCKKWYTDILCVQ